MNQELTAAITDEVMGSLKLPEEQRGTVARYARRAVVSVLDQCNREDMPDALQVLTAEIVEDMLRTDKAVPLPGDGQENEEGKVQSISEGDTSITYAVKETAQELALKQAAVFLKDYRTRLRRFTRPRIPR